MCNGRRLRDTALDAEDTPQALGGGVTLQPSAAVLQELNRTPAQFMAFPALAVFHMYQLIKIAHFLQGKLGFATIIAFHEACAPFPEEPLLSDIFDGIIKFFALNSIRITDEDMMILFPGVVQAISHLANNDPDAVRFRDELEHVGLLAPTVTNLRHTWTG